MCQIGELQMKRGSGDHKLPLCFSVMYFRVDIIRSIPNFECCRGADLDGAVDEEEGLYCYSVGLRTVCGFAWYLYCRMR